MTATAVGLKRAIALASCLVTLSSCASLKVDSFLERGADLRRYHTYDWSQGDNWSTGDARLDNNTLVAARIRSQAEKHLSARGLEKSSTSPDVLVRYYFSLSQKIDIRTIAGDASRGELERKQPFVFDAGTLILDLVEPRTNRLLWRGWAEGSFEGVIDNQAWLEARVDSAVQRILSRLPRVG